MFDEQENIFYYITAMNEFYEMPPMPEGDHIKEGILKGLYKFKASNLKSPKGKAHLFGSGAILNEAIKAQKILEDKYKVAADIWSVTSYKELYYNALMAERNNMLHPDRKPDIPYITQMLEKEKDVFVAASDYIKALPASIAKWIPGRYEILGTDGFGRSDGRAQLRDFFEVDARYIALAALYALAQEKKIEMMVVQRAIKDLEIDPDKLNPMIS